MLAELRDYIKAQQSATGYTGTKADYYSIGKIDANKDKSLGVYADVGGVHVDAIGKVKSYDAMPIRILLHWNKNAKEAETASRDLYQLLSYINGVTMGEHYVQYLYLSEGAPSFVGTDDKGVYEYVIPATIYYRR